MDSNPTLYPLMDIRMNGIMNEIQKPEVLLNCVLLCPIIILSAPIPPPKKRSTSHPIEPLYAQNPQ